MTAIDLTTEITRVGRRVDAQGAVEVLATGAMAVAAGVGHKVLLTAVGTPVLMAAQRRGVTGGDGAKHLPIMSRQAMVLGKVGQRGAHHFAQGDRLGLTGTQITGHGS